MYNFCYYAIKIGQPQPVVTKYQRQILESITKIYLILLLDFSLTVKAATLIFISGCGSAISSAKEGKSGFIYNLVKRN